MYGKYYRDYFVNKFILHVVTFGKLYSIFFVDIKKFLKNFGIHNKIKKRTR